MLNIEKAYDIIVGKLESWVETFVTMLPNMVSCMLLLILFWLIAKISKKLVLKLSRRVSNNVALNKLLETITFILIMSIGFFVALSVLKLDKAVTSLLAGAGVIGLALGFAFQDSANNFISGVFMAARKPFKLGDIITTADEMGVVHEMSLRNTTIHSFQGQEILVPNKEVYQNKLTNYSSLGGRRVDIDVGISYNDDLEKARKVAIESVQKLDFIDKNKEVTLFYSEFGDSSINFTIRFWIDYPDHPDYLTARSEAIITIKKAFDANDISIPFPIRTLDINKAQLKEVFVKSNDKNNEEVKPNKQDETNKD